MATFCRLFSQEAGPFLPAPPPERDLAASEFNLQPPSPDPDFEADA